MEKGTLTICRWSIWGVLMNCMTFCLSYIVLISDFKLHNNCCYSNGVCKDPFVLGSGPQCAALEAPCCSRVHSAVQYHCMTLVDHLHQAVVGRFSGYLAAL